MNKRRHCGRARSPGNEIRTQLSFLRDSLYSPGFDAASTDLDPCLFPVDIGVNPFDVGQSHLMSVSMRMTDCVSRSWVFPTYFTYL